jgi:hypothetical protein
MAFIVSFKNSSQGLRRRPASGGESRPLAAPGREWGERNPAPLFEFSTLLGTRRTQARVLRMSAGDCDECVDGDQGLHHLSVGVIKPRGREFGSWGCAVQYPIGHNTPLR